MVDDHVIPEIYYVIPEVLISAFMYLWNYMADYHVLLETTDILQVCNVGMTRLSTPCTSRNMLGNSGSAYICIHVFPELHG
jgi:hypothetical protein